MKWTRSTSGMTATGSNHVGGMDPLARQGKDLIEKDRL
jgi:hypothetical protein